MITGIEIPIVLECERIATRFAKHTKAWLPPDPGFQRHIKELDEVLTDIIAHPFIKNGAQEPAILLRLDRPLGNNGLICKIRRNKRQVIQPWLGCHTLYNRDELHKPATDLLQKPVDLKWIVSVMTLDDRQRVESNVVFLQIGKALYHPIEGRLTTLVHPVPVVQRARAVDGKPDQKVVLRKEGTPRIIKVYPVGLESILDFPAVCVFFLECNDLSEVFHPQQRRLTPLPGKADDRRVLRFNVLPNIGLQDIVLHRPGRSLLRLRIEVFLLQIEAVCTVQIAEWPDGFRHHMEDRLQIVRYRLHNGV